MDPVQNSTSGRQSLNTVAVFRAVVDGEVKRERLATTIEKDGPVPCTSTGYHLVAGDFSASSIPSRALLIVRATLPPSTLFADRALLRRGYSISEPNALVETVSKYKGLY